MLPAWLCVLAVVVAAAAGVWYGARTARIGARRDSWVHLRRWRSRTQMAQAETERLAQVLEEAFRVVNIGLIHIDELRRVLAANPTSRAWFGINLDTTPTLMTVAGSAELRDVVDRAMAGDSPDDADARVTIRHKAYRVHVAPLADGGALLALRDDTELEQLTRAQRDLVDSFSHDLRTPLTSIRLLAENLSGDPGADSATRSMLAHRLQEQVDALTGLADNLLDLSRLESGRVLLQLRTVVLAELAQGALRTLAPQLETSDVRVVFAIPTNMQVLADGPQIVRVFGNLVDNARCFSPAGSTVEVGARQIDAEHVEIYVRDDGPGISPVDTNRVFERFFRGDRARSGGGKGLGLAIARHIVHGHGGEIWVDTTVPSGATIRFTLPVPPTTTDDG